MLTIWGYKGEILIYWEVTWFYTLVWTIPNLLMMLETLIIIINYIM